MILGAANTSITFQIATVVVPIGVYFFIIGLLNSRQHPQLLTGRVDFALLVVALSPLFVLPALSYFDRPYLLIPLAVGAVGAFIYLLAPRGRTWVIYNMPASEAMGLVEGVLRELELPSARMQDGFCIAGQDAKIEIGGFSLLRNASIRLCGGSGSLADSFSRALCRTVGSVRCEASPMAVAMLLVATAMLVAPLTLVAQQAVQIVRILTDLLY